MVVSLTQSAGHWVTNVDVAGTMQSSSLTEYDSAGRIWKTTEFPTDSTAIEHGLTTTSFYNLKGQITQTISEQWNGAGDAKVEWITRTVFDDQERPFLQTDPYRPGDPVFATQTLYSERTGETYSTVRLKYVTVDISDPDASLPNETSYVEDEFVVTLHKSESYSDRGRLVTSISTDGQITITNTTHWAVRLPLSER